jgi:hypothetical protein
MHRLLTLIASVPAIVAAIGTDVTAAELEGALQYPPPSIGKDAQPAAPAGMVRQPVSPRQIELGVSGSSVAPSIQKFRILPSPGWGEPAEPRFQSGSGG